MQQVIYKNYKDDMTNRSSESKPYCLNR